MKRFIAFIIILIVLLTACSKPTNEIEDMPFFNQVIIQLNDNEEYTFKIKSYEIMDSMILLNTENGKSILVHESKCTLCTLDTFKR